MANRRRKKIIPVKATIIVFAVVVILGIIFLISGGGKIYKSQKANEAEISKNASVLKELETKAPEPVKEAETAAPAPEPAKAEDLSGEEEKILALSSDTFDNDQLRKWFQGSVILGDSITMAAAEYGYLDYDVIIAQIGIGLSNADELFAEAVARQPAVLFICLGPNDISNYMGDPELFISQYDSVVTKLRESLPNTPLYLHAILPEQEGVCFEEGYQYREMYNAALEEYCAKKDNTYYVNADFILEQQPELYDADGMHPTASFYPKWLTYLADVSGLSKTAQEP